MKRYNVISSERRIGTAIYADPEGRFVLYSDALAAIAQARAECERLRADAERYLWLYSKYEGADFRYGEDERSVLTFTWPHAVMASLDAAIDAARREGK